MSRRVVAHVLAVLAICLPAAADDLVPAGSINSAASGDNRVIVVEDQPAARRHAETVHQRFFRDAELIDDTQAVQRSLSGRTVIVYGTPEHAWLKKHAARLPFRFHGGTVEIDGRSFKGERLRVICAIRNPEDAGRRALLYVAARPDDITEINSVLHGLTEWLVADGESTLAVANFRGPPLSADQMLADLEELAQRIERVHPAAVDGLPLELQAAVEQARRELAAPLHRDELWLVLSRVMAVLRDAHSGVNAPWSGETLDLPLLWTTNEGLILTDDADSLRRGDRLVRLAEKTEPQLLELLREVIPAENGHWVRHRGEQMLKDPRLLRTLGIAEAPPVPITVERDGQELTLAVPVRLSGRNDPRPPPWVRFEIDKQHDLGVFLLDRCENNDEYRETLERFFIAVREQEISRIAIDVRRNGGGNSSVLTELLRHIDVDGYTVPGGVIRWSPEARGRVGGAAALLARGTTRFGQHRTPNPRVESPFAGELFILTSKATFSSGNWFALVVQDSRIGQVIGEPTGNAPSSYGDQLPFRLKHSGLSYGLSYKHWLRPDPTRDPADTVSPDHIVPTTRKDVVEGSDPVLRYLREARKAR